MIAGESGEVSPEFLKEDLNLHKAIGLITCASVMAASLYLFSGGDPSRTLSAQTEPAKGSGRQSTVARRFLQEARAEAEKGNVTEARRRAETAKSLSSDWSGVEETPTSSSQPSTVRLPRNRLSRHSKTTGPSRKHRLTPTANRLQSRWLKNRPKKPSPVPTCVSVAKLSGWCVKHESP